MVAFLDFIKGITERKIKQFFRPLDAEGNGVLSADELRRFYKVMATLNHQNIRILSRTVAQEFVRKQSKKITSYTYLAPSIQQFFVHLACLCPIVSANLMASRV